MHALFATASARAATRQPTVVVVDDEPSIVELVHDLLADEGIPTASCPPGRDVPACIRMQQPQLVILDVRMPEIDGIEIFRQLRADPATRTIPVIFFVANADDVAHQLPDYQAQGASLLPKPFNREELLDVVQQALGASYRS